MRQYLLQYSMYGHRSCVFKPVYVARNPLSNIATAYVPKWRDDEPFYIVMCQVIILSLPTFLWSERSSRPATRFLVDPLGVTCLGPGASFCLTKISLWKNKQFPFFLTMVPAKHQQLGNY